ncbi:MAG: hypothetical protein U1E36_06735 [Rickettsiales bacterium]
MSVLSDVTPITGPYIMYEALHEPVALSPKDKLLLDKMEKRALTVFHQHNTQHFAQVPALQNLVSDAVHAYLFSFLRYRAELKSMPTNAADNHIKRVSLVTSTFQHRLNDMMAQIETGLQKKGIKPRSLFPVRVMMGSTIKGCILTFYDFTGMEMAIPNKEDWKPGQVGRDFTDHAAIVRRELGLPEEDIVPRTKESFEMAGRWKARRDGTGRSIR